MSAKLVLKNASEMQKTLVILKDILPEIERLRNERLEEEINKLVGKFFIISTNGWPGRIKDRDQAIRHLKTDCSYISKYDKIMLFSYGRKEDNCKNAIRAIEYALENGGEVVLDFVPQKLIKE